MGIEFEAKFLDIDVKKMRKILLENGAKRIHKKKVYKRAVFLRCDDSVPGYSRVRKEGKDTTMTIKILKDPKFPEEFEVNIKDSFETGVDFLTALGIKKKAFQESIREKWSHPLVHEITFDTLPGLPTYMEVDCTTEESLNKIIDILGLDMSKKRYGTFDYTYLEYYDIPRDTINQHTPSLTFANIHNEIKPTKNVELFEKMCKIHNKIAKNIESKKTKSNKPTKSA
jgi:adenylate cyclase class 2